MLGSTVKLEPENGFHVNPPTDCAVRQNSPMGKTKTLAAIIRENVQKLRDLRPELNAQRKFATYCGIGEGTVWRIAHEQNGTNVETLHAIAAKFKLSAWQLLIDGFDPKNPPVLAPLTEAEKRLYGFIMEARPQAAAKH